MMPLETKAPCLNLLLLRPLFRILNQANDKASLFKAVILRHDCVHRNGFDKDGNELKVFTKRFVQDSADQIRDFVEGIENAIRSRPGCAF